MLIQFLVKNFRSFQGQQVLSMVASTDKVLLEENTIHTPALSKQRLLRSAVVYGPNASGKSNLIAAFAFVQQFVQSSAERQAGTAIPLQPFLLDETSANSPSEFEIAFVHQDIRYQYGFSVDRQRVHGEWLIAYPKGSPQKWFERSPLPDLSDSEWFFGSQLRGEKEKLVSLTRPDVLFLSVAAKFNHKQLSSVYNWFVEYLRVITVDEKGYGACLPFTAKQTRENDDFRARIKGLLQFADLGIADVSVQETDGLPEDRPENVQKVISSMFDKDGLKWRTIYVQMHHSTQDRTGTGVPFPMESESKGTQKLFCLGGPWLDTLQKGYTLVIDELDSSMHPHLVRALVSMFQRPDVNIQGAQLIFDTHDITLLDTTLFRRDQVWLTEKDNGGASHLYSLLEFSPRKDESLARGYMHGRYGAIPVFGELDFLKGEPPNGKG